MFSFSKYLPQDQGIYTSKSQSPGPSSLKVVREEQLNKRFQDQEQKCNNLWKRADELPEGPSKGEAYKIAQKCTDSQNDLLKTFLNVSKNEETLKVGVSVGPASENKGSILSASPFKKPPFYEDGFIFFESIDTSYILLYVSSYIFILFFLLQFYLFCCFLKSLLIKEYIFSYKVHLKKINFSFYQFIVIFFIGFFFVNFSIAVDIYDINMKMYQLSVVDRNFNIETLRLELGELKYYYFDSIGLKAKSPCELAGTCTPSETGVEVVNPELLKNIELSSKASTQKGPTLPSVLESFDLFCLDNLLIIFIFLGVVIELMIIYAFFYRIYLFGLKGSLEWLDYHIEKALKTPVTFLLVIFSIFLFGCIIFTTHTIEVLSNTMDTIGEGCLTNRDDLIKVSDILLKIAEKIKDF